MDITRLKKRFIEIFGGTESDLRVFTSPGRVNLIGEHTDYNGGYVLPAALTMGTTVVARKKNDRIIKLAATDLDYIIEAGLDSLELYKTLKWGNYQLGVAHELQNAGYKLTGCDMLYHDSVPHGGGLSSSAAIEVATALTLVTFRDEATGKSAVIDLIEIAKICQKAENNYIGVNCGIMDQFASVIGKRDHAIYLECKNLNYSHVPLNLNKYKIVISNTNKKRNLSDSKYNKRRSECEQGFRMLKKALPRISCLSEIYYKQFDKYKYLIENNVVRKRIEHVITENDRVLKSVEALNAGDIKGFGNLMLLSHYSLKNLYEVTGTELDTLVEEALKVEGVLGSRMTGAGFGGCTVSIVDRHAVNGFIERVGVEYRKKIGLKASFYVSDVGDGCREIK